MTVFVHLDMLNFKKYGAIFLIGISDCHVEFENGRNFKHIFPNYIGLSDHLKHCCFMLLFYIIYLRS